MKRFTLFVLISLSIFSQEQLWSQEKKLHLNVEYMLATTRISEPDIRTQNIFGYGLSLHAEYLVAKDARIRLGIGLLEVGEKIIREPNVAFKLSEETFTHTFLHIPVGLKLLSGNYFLIPEVGLGINRRNRFDTYQVTFAEEIEDEEIFEFSGDVMLSEGSFNTITFPFALTAGVFIPIKKEFGISISAKIFTSINSIVRDIPRTNRYSGAGLVAGFHF